MTSLNSSSSCPSFTSESTVPPKIDDFTSPKFEDPLEKNFATKNQSGETVLYEAIGEIVRIAIFAYANYDESCEFIGHGKITIMFYPHAREIRVILRSTSDSWPVRNEIMNDKQRFDYDGWYWRDDGRNRMCKKREDLGSRDRERGFVFGDWNYYGVAFGTEDEIFQLRNIIGIIQRRISNGRIPEINDFGDVNSNMRISRFWCETGLRMSDVTVVCIHSGSVWRINGSYSVEHDGNGTIALTTKTETPEILEMLIVFRCRNREEIEDVKKCYRIPATMSFVASHITPENKNNYVLQWTIGGDLWACAFQNFDDAGSFKKIIDYYVGQLKKANKKFFSKK